MSEQFQEKQLEATIQPECFILLRIWRGSESSALVYWVVLFLGLEVWRLIYARLVEAAGSFTLLTGLGLFLLLPSVGLWRAAIARPKPWAFRTWHFLCLALLTAFTVQSGQNAFAEHRLISIWHAEIGEARSEITLAPDHSYVVSHWGTTTNTGGGKWRFWGNKLILTPTERDGHQLIQNLFACLLTHGFVHSNHGNSWFWRNVSFSPPSPRLPGNKTFGAIRRVGQQT